MPAPLMRCVHPNLGYGSQGQSVWLLQAELDTLHYVVPRSGVFDEGTGRALIAYRKMTGLERVPYAGGQVFYLLAHHAGGFRVRYRGDGRHVEGDLTRQVLAEIEAGGRVHAIYMMSSGKPSTPTVVGRFQVYSKTPGENSHGMVDSNYFISGYAIHGYAELLTQDLATANRARFDPDSALASVNAISDAADRAAALTAQLLSFSRQQVVTMRVLLNHTIHAWMNAAKVGVDARHLLQFHLDAHHTGGAGHAGDGEFGGFAPCPAMRERGV